MEQFCDMSPLLKTFHECFHPCSDHIPAQHTHFVVADQLMKTPICSLWCQHTRWCLLVVVGAGWGFSRGLWLPMLCFWLSSFRLDSNLAPVGFYFGKGTARTQICSFIQSTTVLVRRSCRSMHSQFRLNWRRKQRALCAFFVFLLSMCVSSSSPPFLLFVMQSLHCRPAVDTSTTLARRRALSLPFSLSALFFAFSLSTTTTVWSDRFPLFVYSSHSAI